MLLKMKVKPNVPLKKLRQALQAGVVVALIGVVSPDSSASVIIDEPDPPTQQGGLFEYTIYGSGLKASESLSYLRGKDWYITVVVDPDELKVTNGFSHIEYMGQMESFKFGVVGVDEFWAGTGGEARIRKQENSQGVLNVVNMDFDFMDGQLTETGLFLPVRARGHIRHSNLTATDLESGLPTAFVIPDTSWDCVSTLFVSAGDANFASGGYGDVDHITWRQIPEPTSLAVCAGLAGLAALKRRRRLV